MDPLGLRRIVTGGQTGVDQGALEAALEAGFPCGGWCPEDRGCETGTIPGRYPVEPLAGADNAGRTRANVRGSGATLVLFFRTPDGGTAETLAACRAEGKPHLAIDAAAVPPAAAAARAAAFLRRHRPAVLNVAGPRASEEPGAHAYARDCLRALLREMRGRG